MPISQVILCFVIQIWEITELRAWPRPWIWEKMLAFSQFLSVSFLFFVNLWNSFYFYNPLLTTVWSEVVKYMTSVSPPLPFWGAGTGLRDIVTQRKRWWLSLSHVPDTELSPRHIESMKSPSIPGSRVHLILLLGGRTHLTTGNRSSPGPKKVGTGWILCQTGLLSYQKSRTTSELTRGWMSCLPWFLSSLLNRRQHHLIDWEGGQGDQLVLSGWESKGGFTTITVLNQGGRGGAGSWQEKCRTIAGQLEDLAEASDHVFAMQSIFLVLQLSSLS